MVQDHVDKKLIRQSNRSFADYVNISILLGEPLVPLLAYTIVRLVVDATEIIRYVESGLTGHLNNAQTLVLLCVGVVLYLNSAVFYLRGGGGR